MYGGGGGGKTELSNEDRGSGKKCVGRVDGKNGVVGGFVWVT